MSEFYTHLEIRVDRHAQNPRNDSAISLEVEEKQSKEKTNGSMILPRGFIVKVSERVGAVARSWHQIFALSMHIWRSPIWHGCIWLQRRGAVNTNSARSCQLSGVDISQSHAPHLCPIKLKSDPAIVFACLFVCFKIILLFFFSTSIRWKLETSAAAPVPECVKVNVRLLCFSVRLWIKKKEEEQHHQEWRKLVRADRWDAVGSSSHDFEAPAAVERERRNESDECLLWGVALHGTKTSESSCSSAEEALREVGTEDEWWLAAVSVSDLGRRSLLFIWRWVMNQILHMGWKRNPCKSIKAVMMKNKLFL